MKKQLILVLFTMGFLPFLFSQEVVDVEPLEIMTPEVLAQGGSFTANGAGYLSLMTNPATLKQRGFSLNLAGLSTTLFLNPRLMVESVAGEEAGKEWFTVLLEDQDAIIGPLLDDPTAALPSLALTQLSKNGFGADLLLSALDLSILGLGVGEYLTVKTYARQESALGIDIMAEVQNNISVGYSHRIKLKKKNSLDIGVALRSNMIMYSSMGLGLSSLAPLLSGGGDNIQDLLIDLLLGQVYLGQRLVIDSGILLTQGPFKIGFSIRDIELSQRVASAADIAESGEDIGDIIENDTIGFLLGTAFDSFKNNNLKLNIPVNTSLGLSIHPDLGVLAWLIDPEVHVQWDRPVAFLLRTSDNTFWTNLKMGAEITLLKMISVRAGLNSGYISAGLGLHLLLIEANLAAFTTEFGEFVGDKPTSGIVFDVAIRI